MCDRYSYTNSYTPGLSHSYLIHTPGGLFTKGVLYHVVAETNGSFRRIWIGTGTSLAPMEADSILTGHEYWSGVNTNSQPITVIGAFYGTSGAFNGVISSVRIDNNTLDYIGEDHI